MRWGKKVQRRFYFILAGQDLDVDRPAIQRIAAPLEFLSVGKEFQSSQVCYRAVGRMLTGNPLRVIQRESSRSGWNLQARMKNLARRLAGVYRQLDCRPALGH